ncbi:MAG TPA: KGG domain-containing protein [Sphingomicrobium sp.]|nr:KGG domain-containing protein [Sphingomicrobium sp.]
MPTKSASSGVKRGFAAMSPEKQREIASKGGKASHGGGRKSSRLV